MDKIFALVIAISITFAATAKDLNICRWTSDYSCKEKAIGSFCGTRGICSVERILFSEPECKCSEPAAKSAVAKDLNICRWTSDYSCKEKAIGSFCGTRGICSVERILFSEPECKCSESAAKSARRASAFSLHPEHPKHPKHSSAISEGPQDHSFCRWTSDFECRGHLPGVRRGGVCQIESIEFGEPRCVFKENKRD